MCPFFHSVSSFLLSEEIKWYPVLYDMKMKGYRKKDIVSNMWNAMTKDLEFTENGKTNLILIFVSNTIGCWEELAGLYYSHVKIIRSGGRS